MCVTPTPPAAFPPLAATDDSFPQPHTQNSAQRLGPSQNQAVVAPCRGTATTGAQHGGCVRGRGGGGMLQKHITAQRGAEKQVGGSRGQLWTPLPRVGGNGRSVRRWRCSEVFGKSFPYWGVSVRDTGALWSLRRALHHVHLGWDPPSAALAGLLTPSGTRCGSFLQSRARTAAIFLCSSALAMPEQPPRGREEQDPINVIFDRKTPCRLRCLSA